MKYKIGDQVKYDGGDWWFYGTVSAVFEHSICPCYRLNVERMEKKSCKFSITQFEFELDADDVEIGKNKRKKEENWQQIKPEPEQKVVLKLEPVLKQRQKKKQKSEPEEPVKEESLQKPSKRNRGDAWEKNFEMFCKGEKNNTIYSWITYNRKQQKTGKLASDKLEKLKKANFPFEVDTKEKEKDEAPKEQKKKTRKKRGDAWESNVEAFRNGEKNNTLSTWIAYNRKQFKLGKLPDDKYKELVELNFPFDTVKKNDDVWDSQLEAWKNGDRKSIPMQQWRQRSIKQFAEGRLSGDQIVQLREAGILK
jgi:hypothetical protein